MAFALTNEPVSTTSPQLRKALLDRLQKGERVVTLRRCANCGGAKDYYLLKSSADFDNLLQNARAKTSLTFFLEESFPLRGTAGSELMRSAIALLSRTAEEYEGIDIVRFDSPATELDQNHYLFLQNEEQIREWFQANAEAKVLIGTLIFWRNNCEHTFTAYVPDEDGVIRPGAY